MTRPAQINPRGPATLLLALTLALPTACMKPNPYAEELAEDGGEDSGEDTGEDESGEPLPDFPANDGEGSCGDALGFDEACTACLAEGCCAAAFACAGDPDCACLSDCLLAGGTTGSCNKACDAKLTKVETVEPLLACIDDSCPMAC